MILKAIDMQNNKDTLNLLLFFKFMTKYRRKMGNIKRTLNSPNLLKNINDRNIP
ncbi:hypothetical protein M1145_03490 [Patescibacteria group bacterium]|nr:hypothetical protein [Patescibacteria group bacterium]